MKGRLPEISTSTEAQKNEGCFRTEPGLSLGESLLCLEVVGVRIVIAVPLAVALLALAEEGLRSWLACESSVVAVVMAAEVERPEARVALVVLLALARVFRR